MTMGGFRRRECGSERRNRFLVDGSMSVNLKGPPRYSTLPARVFFFHGSRNRPIDQNQRKARKRGFSQRLIQRVAEILPLFTRDGKASFRAGPVDSSPVQVNPKASSLSLCNRAVLPDPLHRYGPLSLAESLIPIGTDRVVLLP